MLAASRQALATLRERLNAATTGSSGEELTGLAGELTSVAGLLQNQPRLRRTLADPTTEPGRRRELVERLLSGRVSATALTVVGEAVAQRWSNPWDLVDSLEAAADEALFAAAERDGVLDGLEDELFRFERIVEGSGELAALLDEHGVDAERRVGLLDSLLAGKAHPITRALLAQAVRSTRRRTLVVAIDNLLEAAAARRDRSVARVVSAVELTDEQVGRLAAALSATYGRAISVRTAIDPAVRGGLVVRVADEVIDGSVATQLLRARKALAG